MMAMLPRSTDICKWLGSTELGPDGESKFAGEAIVVITIVCACGEHNAVSEHDLDTAECGQCHALLLAKADVPQSEVQRRAAAS